MRKNNPPTKEELLLGRRVKYTAESAYAMPNGYRFRAFLLARVEFGFVRDNYVLTVGKKKLIKSRDYKYFEKRFNQLEEKYSIILNREQ